MRSAGFAASKTLSFSPPRSDLKKPERVMALLMVMTVCWLVYAAIEYRIGQVLQDHNATFPNQQGNRCRTRRHAGYSITLSGFLCSASLGSGTPWW